jgi:hypothetical protein
MHALNLGDLDQPHNRVPTDQYRLRILVLQLRWMGLDAEAEQMSGLLAQPSSTERSQVDPLENVGNVYRHPDVRPRERGALGE